MARFQKGQKRPSKAGRKRGSQNLMTRLIKDAVILAGCQLGDLSGIENLSEEGVEHGKDGLVGFLRWAGKVHTAAFLALLGRIIPMQVVSNEASERRVYHSLEEVERDIAARGFSIADFGRLLIEAKAIEAEATKNQTKGPASESNEKGDANANKH